MLTPGTRWPPAGLARIQVRVVPDGRDPVTGEQDAKGASPYAAAPISIPIPLRGDGKPESFQVEMTAVIRGGATTKRTLTVGG